MVVAMGRYYWSLQWDDIQGGFQIRNDVTHHVICVILLGDGTNSTGGGKTQIESCVTAFESLFSPKLGTLVTDQPKDRGEYFSTILVVSRAKLG